MASNQSNASNSHSDPSFKTYIYPTYETRFAIHFVGGDSRRDQIFTFETKDGLNLRLRKHDFDISDANGTYTFLNSVRDLVLNALTFHGGRIQRINGRELLTDDNDVMFTEWHPTLAWWNWADCEDATWMLSKFPYVRIITTEANIYVREVSTGKNLATVQKVDYARYRELGHYRRFGFTLSDRLFRLDTHLSAPIRV